jgi:hypothetical protein
MTPSNENRASDPPIRRSDDGGAPQARDVDALPRLARGLGRLGAPPPAGERTPRSPCGHTRHVGTCPTCQRVQLARWRRQLAHADAAAPASGKEAGT